VGPEIGDTSANAGRYVDWRFRCLTAAGFERSAADRLARDRAWDLHALLELVDRGCRPELAERIVAPHDQEASRK
jgi:hypothetical protein